MRCEWALSPLPNPPISWTPVSLGARNPLPRPMEQPAMQQGTGLPRSSPPLSKGARPPRSCSSAPRRRFAGREGWKGSSRERHGARCCTNIPEGQQSRRYCRVRLCTITFILVPLQPSLTSPAKALNCQDLRINRAWEDPAFRLLARVCTRFTCTMLQFRHESEYYSQIAADKYWKIIYLDNGFQLF